MSSQCETVGKCRIDTEGQFVNQMGQWNKGGSIVSLFPRLLTIECTEDGAL